MSTFHEFAARLTRREAVAAAGAAALVPAAAGAAPAPVVTLLGDSITAGYGLPGRDALPAQLQRALAEIGVNAVVRGAGVSGDTTAGGLRRVGQVRGDTDLCVVALGGNDLLRGLSPQTTQSNLDAIVARLKDRGIDVLVAGMQAPLELGAFAHAFNSAFTTVARNRRVPLYPFLLQGVVLDPRYNQPDRIHPNAAGVRVIARNLAPAVARALRAGGTAVAA